MSDRHSPEHVSPGYAAHAHLMDRAWTEMIADRLSNPETLNDALDEIEYVRSESLESRIDSVTGLANHRGFTERLEMAYQYAVRHQREGLTFHVDAIDIKDMKGWNRLGHSTGDQALRTVARVLQNVCRRRADFAARVGGDEFAVVRENGNPDDTFVSRLFEELDRPENYVQGRPIELYVGGASWHGKDEAPEVVYAVSRELLSMAKSKSANYISDR